VQNTREGCLFLNVNNSETESADRVLRGALFCFCNWISADLRRFLMIVKDVVNNVEVELDRDGLIQKMKDGRQVDLILKEKKTDDVGYLTWDMEQWSTVDGKRFIRTYQLEGRVLSEYTSHNIHDLKAYFMPDEALAVQLS
jgi:hypothetical protein